jgi:hypothetical protein
MHIRGVFPLIVCTSSQHKHTQLLLQLGSVGWWVNLCMPLMYPPLCEGVTCAPRNSQPVVVQWLARSLGGVTTVDVNCARRGDTLDSTERLL